MDLSKPAYQACTEPMLSHLNVGTGTDVSIRELAETIQHVVGFTGDIIWGQQQTRWYTQKTNGQQQN